MAGRVEFGTMARVIPLDSHDPRDGAQTARRLGPPECRLRILVLSELPEVLVDGQAFFTPRRASKPAAYLRALAGNARHGDPRVPTTEIGQWIRELRDLDDPPDAVSLGEYRRELRRELRAPPGWWHRTREEWEADVIGPVFPDLDARRSADARASLGHALDLAPPGLRVELDVAEVRERVGAVLTESLTPEMTRVRKALTLVHGALRYLSREHDAAYRILIVESLLDGLAARLMELAEHPADPWSDAWSWIEASGHDLAERNLRDWVAWTLRPPSRLPTPADNQRRSPVQGSASDFTPDILLRRHSKDRSEILRRDAIAIGVKPCLDRVPSSAGGLSFFIPRDVDVRLADALRHALAAPGGFHVVLANGPSFSGKTRSVVQGLMAAGQDFTLSIPAHVAALEEWLNGDLEAVASAAPLLVFVDELEAFVPARRLSWGSWFDRLAVLADDDVAHAVVLVGTSGGSGIAPLDYDIAALTRGRSTQHLVAIRHHIVRDADSALIEFGHSGFDSPEAQATIAARYDKGESHEWTDLAKAGQFLRTLWAGPWLEARFRDGLSRNIGETRINPRGQAIAWASMLLRRAGAGGSYVSARLLEAVHSGYGSLPRIDGGASPSELAEALDWATRRGPDGASRLVEDLAAKDTELLYRSPAFVAERLVELDDLPAEKAARDEFIGILNANGVNSDIAKAVERTLAELELERCRPDIKSRVHASSIRVSPGGASTTRGPAHHSSAEVSVRGIDVTFDDGRVEARLRVSDGHVLARIRTADPGVFRRGLALIVGSGPSDAVDDSTICIDRGSGPAWSIATGLSAPSTERDWLRLTERLTILPLGDREVGRV